MTSVYIIGNCHYHGMRRCIEFFDSALRIEGCAVCDLGTQFADADALLSRLQTFDHVLTLGFETPFLPGLSSGVIAKQVPQAILYPTVIFGAFHPDVVYLFSKAGGGDYLASALGPFHSALALFGYRKGFDVARTMGLFRAETYEAAGYLSAWDVAMSELEARPEARSFGLAGMALTWLRQGCFMHNPLHPRVGPIADIAAEAMTRMGLRAKHGSPEAFIPDDLLISHVWPTYPEIARLYGVPGAYTFKRQGGPSRWPEFMTLEEFILASFECYRHCDWDSYYCDRVDQWLSSGLSL